MSLDDHPLFKRAKKRGDNGHGALSEARVIKALGGRPQPNSGAMRGAKSDATLDKDLRFQIECKSTSKLIMPLDYGWLVKIQKEALAHGRVPILTVSFVSSDGKNRDSGDWVMMPKTYFDELTE